MGSGDWRLGNGDWGLGNREPGAVSGQPMWEPAFRLLLSEFAYYFFQMT